MLNNNEPEMPFPFDDLHQEAERLRHCQDGNDSYCNDSAIGYENPFECYGTFRCACGCHQTVICPGGDLCRARIMRLKGRTETAAVREWMRRGLCICPFVLKNYERPLGNLSDYAYTKSSGNWSASRRRKLVQCPCGAFFCNDTARAAGLYSESEWKRKGYDHFRQTGPDISRYYLDPITANRRSRYGFRRVLPDGSLCQFTHVRTGPQPTARIWRAFYEPSNCRWERGVHSVDLFSADAIDLTRFLLTRQQVIALSEGDQEILELVREHNEQKRKQNAGDIRN